MKRLLAATAVVALVAGGAALAQSADTSGSTDTTFGSQVKVLAQGQKDSDTKGIGSQVSTMAHDRNAARAAARTGDDDTDTSDTDTDTDNDDNTAVTTAASADVATDASFGSQVKALAQGQQPRRGFADVKIWDMVAAKAPQVALERLDHRATEVVLARHAAGVQQ